LCEVGTVPCDVGTVLCDAGTVLCDDGTVLCDAGTVLCDAGAVLCDGFAVLCDGFAVGGYTEQVFLRAAQHLYNIESPDMKYSVKRNSDLQVSSYDKSGI